MVSRQNVNRASRVKYSLERKGEKRRARMSVGAFVNDWIDEVFNLEYDEARWRRVKKGMVVGGVVLAVASALEIYTNWRFIWRAVLFWGVCLGKRNQNCAGKGRCLVGSMKVGWWNKEIKRFAGLMKKEGFEEGVHLLNSIVEIRFTRGVMHVVDGVWRKEGELVVEMGKERVVEVNIQSHELLQVSGEEVNGIEHNQVLDLNDDGERWEGDVLNSKPCGWGVEFDSENRMAYEGFRIGDLNVCYGTRYYSDVGVIEYEGEWLEGQRWGRGVQYDRTGKTVYEGEWMNDEQLITRAVLSEANQLLHNHIEELIASNGSCNGEEWKEVDLSLLPCLKTLHVGNSCFMCVDRVKLIGMKLERVSIGENCFTMHSYCENMGARFHLKDCERLRELKIGKHSFSDYLVCEIENNACLEVIEIGDMNEESNCFYYGSLTVRSECDGIE